MNHKPIYTEFACYDLWDTAEIRQHVFKAIEMGVQGISVQYDMISEIVKFMPNGLVFSCPIDYPYGQNDTVIRLNQIQLAIRKGINAIDLVAPINQFLNKRYTIFEQDIKAVCKIAKENNISVRVMLDYRKCSSYEDCINMCTILELCGVDYIFPSTGCWVDEFSENLIIASVISKNVSLPIIANGNFYLHSHFQAAVNSGVFGVRFGKINALENCLKVYNNI